MVDFTVLSLGKNWKVSGTSSDPDKGPRGSGRLAGAGRLGASGGMDRGKHSTAQELNNTVFFHLPPAPHAFFIPTEIQGPGPLYPLLTAIGPLWG